MADDSKNLMEKAYWEIKTMLFKQKIIAGQKLFYRDLSEKLGMSKTPIIYAMGRLEQEGFFKLAPNHAYFVREFDLREFEEYFDIRKALEVHAIDLAIKNYDNAEVKKLEEKVQKHRDYVVPVYDRRKLVLEEARIRC